MSVNVVVEVCTILTHIVFVCVCEALLKSSFR